MHIDGSSNAKTKCPYKFRVLYFRFIIILLIKKKCTILSIKDLQTLIFLQVL